MEVLFGGKPKTGTVALIDADTIVYAVCVGLEYASDLLDWGMHTVEERADIEAKPNYDEAEHCLWEIDLEGAVKAAVVRVEDLINKTNTDGAELYFTQGKNFRYTLEPMYKANRKNTRYPVGMAELKLALLDLYAGEIGTNVEADDIVVYKKRTQPEKYVLCAVDKDVYKSVPGEHWNYYFSLKYNIHPKWVTTTKEDAELFPYVQTLMGDSTDNIKGCPGVGIKTALKALSGFTTSKDRWDCVVDLFLSKGLTVKDAIRDMRLVNMHQVSPDEKGGWVWTPWTPPQ